MLIPSLHLAQYMHSEMLQYQTERQLQQSPLTGKLRVKRLLIICVYGWFQVVLCQQQELRLQRVQEEFSWEQISTYKVYGNHIIIPTSTSVRLPTEQ